jgi:hypothetical protein
MFSYSLNLLALVPLEDAVTQLWRRYVSYTTRASAVAGMILASPLGLEATLQPWT